MVVFCHIAGIGNVWFATAALTHSLIKGQHSELVEVKAAKEKHAQDIRGYLAVAEWPLPLPRRFETIDQLLELSVKLLSKLARDRVFCFLSFL